MKKAYYTIIFGCICIIVVVLISQKVNFGVTDDSSYSGALLLPGEEICGNSKIECSALKKINDRLRFMNNITAISYSIDTKSGKTIATINFPAFSDRTKEEKDEIIKKIQQANVQTLAIGIASKDPGYIQDVKNILPRLKFDEIHIQIYSEPANIIELFDTITWKKSKKLIWI